MNIHPLSKLSQFLAAIIMGPQDRKNKPAKPFEMPKVKVKVSIKSLGRFKPAGFKKAKRRFAKIQRASRAYNQRAAKR